ncbi:MAG: ASKHA domain-containing protein [Acidimicrobiales bacterium]|nr:ASKHA domain-containing protein [Acidimicrobiales bacterium]
MTDLAGKTDAFGDERVTVVFTPSGVTTDVARGTSLLDAARSVGADIDSTCGGRGLCGRCQVTPSIGEFAKWGITSDASAVSPWTTSESDYKGRRRIEPGSRLGCQANALTDVVIDIPPASQVNRPVVRKKIDLPGLTLDPLITARYVELPELELGDERADVELLRDALTTDWGLDSVAVESGLLPLLHPAIVEGKRAVTAVVHRNGTVLAVRPGFDEVVYGIAVDVGSTTIAGYLVDLASGDVVANAGAMNPQIRFGEDLMSRVSYVMMNPGGDHELTSAVRSALDQLVTDLADDLDTELDEAAVRARIHDIVMVGNPVMHHLLLGIDPTPLGAAPFTLTTGEPVDMRAVDLDLDLPFARAHVGPCIAGHVGADAAAATLNERTHDTVEPQLMVDVGTNAEIVLGTADRTYAASSPTGPAFEGAQISSGIRATAGAIERIRIDRKTYEPRFKVIGADAWSDEPEFVAQTAKLDIAGLCGSAIIEVIGEIYLAGICDHNGVIQDLATKTDRVVPDERTFTYVIRPEFTDNGTVHPQLAITQNDVRQIQLAGSALRAGIDLLMEHAGITECHDVRLAGAFGAHIDPVYALVLGLVPDCPVDSVKAVGNAAGAGTVRMLVSGQQRDEVAAAVRDIEKIETATEPRFQELFVAAMAFPHASAPSPHLAEVVRLPKRIESEGSGRRGRRRRQASTER